MGSFEDFFEDVDGWMDGCLCFCCVFVDGVLGGAVRV